MKSQEVNQLPVKCYILRRAAVFGRHTRHTPAKVMWCELPLQHTNSNTAVTFEQLQILTKFYAPDVKLISLNNRLTRINHEM